MTYTDSTDNTNTAKSNSHNQSQNANTEAYSNFIDSMEYFSAFGFLLTGLANYAFHEKRIFNFITVFLRVNDGVKREDSINERRGLENDK